LIYYFNFYFLKVDKFLFEYVKKKSNEIGDQQKLYGSLHNLLKKMNEKETGDHTNLKNEILKNLEYDHEFKQGSNYFDIHSILEFFVKKVRSFLLRKNKK
jgi:hypothetical protein